MSLWSAKTEVKRGYDENIDFFPSEHGFKEYRLFGILVYRRDFKSSTKMDVVDKTSTAKKKDSGIGFKNK